MQKSLAVLIRHFSIECSV